MAALWTRLSRELLTAAVQGAAEAGVHRSFGPAAPGLAAEPMHIVCTNSIAFNEGIQPLLGIGAAAAVIGAATCAHRAGRVSLASGAAQITDGPTAAEQAIALLASQSAAVAVMGSRLEAAEQAIALLRFAAASQTEIDERRISDHLREVAETERESVVEDLRHDMDVLEKTIMNGVDEMRESVSVVTQAFNSHVTHQQKELIVVAAELHETITEFRGTLQRMATMRPHVVRTPDFVDISSNSEECDKAEFVRAQRAACADAYAQLQARSASDNEHFARVVFQAWSHEALLN
eukprot:16032269-Heterocapsa_arctica.AAC.1